MGLLVLLQLVSMIQKVYKAWSRTVEFSRKKELKEDVQVDSIPTNVLLTIHLRKANEK